MAIEYDDEEVPSGAGDSAMSNFLKDTPFKGSRKVYVVIKILVLILAAWLALRFVFGVV